MGLGESMKVSINENGLLTIKSETPLEDYALRQWTKENEELFSDGNTSNIIFVCDNRS